MKATDAGELRESLAEDLAAWIEAGVMPLDWTRDWTRRLRALADLTGFAQEVLIADLERDARARHGEVAP